MFFKNILLILLFSVLALLLTGCEVFPTSFADNPYNFDNSSKLQINVLVNGELRIDLDNYVSFETSKTKVETDNLKEIMLTAKHMEDSIFLGWYQDKTLENLISDNKSAKINIESYNKTIFAHYIRSTESDTSSSLFLDFNDGIREIATYPLENSINLELPNPPTREGYSFLGFFDSKENGTMYYNSQMQKTINYSYDEDLFLYAQWVKTSNYQINFFYDISKSNLLATTYAEYNEKISEDFFKNISIIQEIEGNSSFLKWEYFDGEYFKQDIIKQDLDIWASWEHKQYQKVYLNFNDEKTGFYKNIYIEEGVSILESQIVHTIPRPSSLEYGEKIFQGWEFTIRTPYGTYSQKLTEQTVIDDDTYLYSNWEEGKIVNLTLDFNLPISTLHLDKQVLKIIKNSNVDTTSFSFLPISPKVYGFSFKGWSVEEDALAPDRDDNYIIDGPEIWYAVWDEVNIDSEIVEIVFNLNYENKSILETKQYYNNHSISEIDYLSLPPTPHIDKNIYFKGWAAEEDALTPNRDANYIIDGPEIWYAIWEIKIEFIDRSSRYENPSILTNYSLSISQSGKEAAVPTFSRNDYFLWGWSTNQTAVYPNRDLSYKLTISESWYPVWVEETLAVNYHSNLNKILVSLNFFDINHNSIEGTLSVHKNTNLNTFGKTTVKIQTTENVQVKYWYYKYDGKEIPFDKYSYIPYSKTNIDLYPKIQKQIYAITFKNLHPEKPISPIKLNIVRDTTLKESKHSFPLIEKQLSNHYFSHWEFRLVTPYGLYQEIIDESSQIYTNMNIYAIWKEITATKYEVTFTGPHFENDYVYEIPLGSSFKDLNENIPSPPVIEGKIFTHWELIYRTPYGPYIQDFDISTEVTFPFDVYPRYSSSNYNTMFFTVEFDLSSLDMDNLIYRIENGTSFDNHSNISFPLPLHKNNHHFIKWKSILRTPYGTYPHKDIFHSASVVNSDITVLPVYSETRLFVELIDTENAESNKYWGYPNQRVPQYNSFYTPESNSKSFLGWFTKPGGEGLMYTHINSISMAKTFYAYWMKKDSQIEINYLHNLEAAKSFNGFNKNGFINNQNLAHVFKESRATSDIVGCGWISIYNTLHYLRGQGEYNGPIDIPQIIKHLEYTSEILNTGGKKPSGIANYLGYLGFKANIEFTNLEEHIKTSPISILVNINLSFLKGGHYTTLVYNEDTDKIKSYNLGWNENTHNNFDEIKDFLSTSIFMVITVN